MSGYHVRTLAETGVGRVKEMFNGHLANRSVGTQQAEAGILCRSLNLMTRQGKLVTCRVM